MEYIVHGSSSHKHMQENQICDYCTTVHRTVNGPIIN